MTNKMNIEIILTKTRNIKIATIKKNQNINHYYKNGVQFINLNDYGTLKMK
jgi:hypothetical protein